MKSDARKAMEKLLWEISKIQKIYGPHEIGCLRIELDTDVDLLGPIFTMLGIPEDTGECNPETGEPVGTEDEVSAAYCRDVLGDDFYKIEDEDSISGFLDSILENAEHYKKKSKKTTLSNTSPWIDLTIT